MNSNLLKLLIIMVLPLSLSVNAENARHIHINNEHLEINDIQLLDQIVGSQVGDGFYWLNMQTGQWGYEGNDQVQGIVKAIADQAVAQQSNNQQQQNQQGNDADKYNSWEGVDQNGSVVSGKVNGKKCTYVSVAGTTLKSCD